MPGFHTIGPASLVMRVAAITAIAIGLGACQTTGEGGVMSSADKVELSSASADAIAGDMVSKLAEVVGPGTGTIILKSDGSRFRQALETSLKGWGYAVASPEQKTEASETIHLAYGVDNFEGSVLARLSTPTVDLGRVYSVTGEGASPSSPLSILRRR
jgi:hypothetical protein